MLLTLRVLLFAAVLGYNLNKGIRSKDVSVSAKGLLFANLYFMDIISLVF